MEDMSALTGLISAWDRRLEGDPVHLAPAPPCAGDGTQDLIHAGQVLDHRVVAPRMTWT